MKIAHLTHHLNPYGTERVMLSLLKYRGARYEEQFVVSTQDGDITPEMRATGCAVYVETARDRLIQHLAQADLINAHCLYVDRGYEMLDLIRAAGRPHLFTLHWPTPFPEGMSEVYVCTSAAAARAQHPSASTVVVENGIDLEPFQEVPSHVPGERLTLCRACRPEKCGEYFWYAMADVLARHPHVDLRVVGSLCRSEGRVDAVGVCTDIRQGLAGADLFVYTPRPGEGTKDLIVMEAMALGLPAVFSNVETTRASAVAGQTALMVPYGDTEALTGAIETLICDPELRCQLGAAARRHAFRHFDARDRVRQYEEVYLHHLSRAYARRPAAPAASGWNPLRNWHSPRSRKAGTS